MDYSITPVRLRSGWAAAVVPALLVLVTSGGVWSYRWSYRGSVFPTQQHTQPDIAALLQRVDRFDVARERLPNQLEELLNRRGISYIYTFWDLRAVQGNEVHGQLSLQAALQQVLDGTGCHDETFASYLEISCKAVPAASVAEH